MRFNVLGRVLPSPLLAESPNLRELACAQGALASPSSRCAAAPDMECSSSRRPAASHKVARWTAMRNGRPRRSRPTAETRARAGRAHCLGKLGCVRRTRCRSGFYTRAPYYPAPPMNATASLANNELTSALARHIDEHHGDYPLVIFEDDGLRVVAMYKNMELDIVVDVAQSNSAQRGKHLTELYVASVPDAIRLITQIESIRQKRRHPMLRF